MTTVLNTMSNSNKVFFTSGPLSVTETMLRFRGRRYKLHHIENLILKRPLFLMGLGIGGFTAGFAIFNTDILYSYEFFIALVLAVGFPAITWPFGTLSIQSRTLATDGGSITWFHKDLAKVQNAIEQISVAHKDKHIHIN